ncbi:MAG: serine/threonine protein kinase, partial [Acidobacteriota bacterium]|nr:serine/threonine protein kinase [Acidobacteriota bacterium]
MSAALSAKKSTEETVRRVRRSIGPYEIECEIGRGSCGTVFLGRELESGRVAALKTLSPKLGAARERLEVYRHCLLGRDHESGVCSHPGIVAVYDVIGHDLDIRDAEGGRGRVSIAMEYVEGTDLAARLADPEPLPFEFIARVVREVAAALDHVHALGVVHRDIKPSNILVASDHSVRVTDFGIASLSGEDLSDDLERLGSPNYLAPERVLGLETDHRVDVYALGAVLYEMLTRQPPFSGDSVAELLRNIAAGTLLPVSRLRSREDRELDGIVSMALARDPEHRFQTAGELAAALNRYVDKQAERSHTVPTPLLGELTDLEDDLLADAVVLNGDGSRGQIIETEPPAVESRADAGAPVARSGSRVGWVLLPVLFGLAVAAGLYFLPRPDGSARSAQQDSVTAVPPDSKYLSLLEESRQLYVGGEPEAAAKMLRRAEKLSPDRSRIQ